MVHEIKVHVTTFSVLHKIFNVEAYGYCEIIGLDRWTCGEITDPSYSELTSHEMSRRAMVQAVSRRPFAAEVRVFMQESSRGICGGHTGVESGFSPSTSVFLYRYRSITPPYSLINPPYSLITHDMVLPTPNLYM